MFLEGGMNAKHRGTNDTDSNPTEIFTVELQKGVRGLGLGLIDGLVKSTSLSF